MIFCIATTSRNGNGNIWDNILLIYMRSHFSPKSSHNENSTSSALQTVQGYPPLLYYPPPPLPLPLGQFRARMWPPHVPLLLHTTANNRKLRRMSLLDFSTNCSTTKPRIESFPFYSHLLLCSPVLNLPRCFLHFSPSTLGIIIYIDGNKKEKKRQINLNNL